MSTETDQTTTRREFIKAGAAVAAAGAFGAPMILSSRARAAAAPGDAIRIGLVGCGGRGSGAAAQALSADPGVVLVAMGDVLKSQIDNSLNNIRNEKDRTGASLAPRVKVEPDHMFVGLDAYQKVINSDVDAVLFASPPGFRPREIAAAAVAGKHTFAEKPMGTDPVMVRMAMEAARAFKGKNRSFVAGFCWRYDHPRRQFYQRIHDGAIGDVRAIHATYLANPVKPMPKASDRPAGMSDVEWQIRNWYNFVWLSGDGLVEQACHSVDKILWAMNDAPPARAVATGGRMFPNNEGNIYDHIDVFYEWPNGVRATMAQRQMAVPYYDNSDFILGSKGEGRITQRGPEIETTAVWKPEPSPSDHGMYQNEHDEFFASIRSGKPIDNSERMARSTLVGLMGRMAAYTGDQITWQQVMDSQWRLFPEKLEWDMALPVDPIALPGTIKMR